MPFYGREELVVVYDEALDGGFGLIASNIVEPNIMIGLMEGADRVDSDLLLQMNGRACRLTSDGDAVAGLKTMGNYIETIVERYDIGVFLNMSHQADLEFTEQQIEPDIPSSIMIDAPHEPFDEDVVMSREVVEMVEAAGSDVLIEAEPGQIKGVEDEIEAEKAFYTDPEQAVEFVDKTGADLLAISVSTQHGIAKDKDLKLRPDLANDTRQALYDHDLDTPLVLHGSSGVQPDQLQEMLKYGTCKINKNTRHQYEYTRIAYDRYNEKPNAIVPLGGVADARDTFFNETNWSPNKDVFDPRVAGRDIRKRIADVHADLIEVSGNAGQSLFK